MGLFGAIVKTVVNVVKLPVTLPVAVVKDTFDHMDGNRATNVREVIDEIKRDAEDDR